MQTGLVGLQLYNLSTVKLHGFTYQHAFGRGTGGSRRRRHSSLLPTTTSTMDCIFEARVCWSSTVKDIPVRLGFGKVWNFADGKTINFYMEPQYSVWRSGLGAPGWQLFTGVNFQFPVHFQVWSRETRH
jgi:hypothetical protein